mmetsp:Transcript_162944/g.522499  ORF Transcript_162944/g.522499 Transcript_162944/m.522499 type:complete len:237 (+) Transcript_162944:108-818(+)
MCSGDYASASAMVAGPLAKVPKIAAGDDISGLAADAVADAAAAPASPALFPQLALTEAEAAYLCLRHLAPRTWFRVRGLSKGWRRMLDGGAGSQMAAQDGLIGVLLQDAGPLRTANEEIDYAGCVYTAVHWGCTGPLTCLLRPLASPAEWARRPFAVAVAREALLQASLAGDIAGVRAVLALHGPDSPAAGWRRGLEKQDAQKALEALAAWEFCCPDAPSAEERQAVQEALEDMAR